MTRPLAIITTRLPPQTCGIGTHSALLRQHWPDAKRPVDFIVMEDGGGADASRNGDAVTSFNGSAAQLTAALEKLGAVDLILHYAGRAYHRFGCPIWMPRVLARWRHRFPAGRLMMFFHELPGELPITSRHHWLGRIDAHIIGRLAALADVVVTNTDDHAAKLRRIAASNDVYVVPVGSNIDRPGTPAHVRVRTEFVVFGLPFGRLQTLQSFDTQIRRWIENRRLTKLHIVGPAADRFSAAADELIASWPDNSLVARHGALPSAEVSRLLQEAQFALTNVTRSTWSKSGAFMAGAANGCALVMRERHSENVPLCYSIGAEEVDTIADEEVQRRTAALARWYDENADWTVVARRLASLWPEARRS